MFVVVQGKQVLPNVIANGYLANNHLKRHHVISEARFTRLPRTHIRSGFQVSEIEDQLNDSFFRGFVVPYNDS